ncbi:putative hemolysin [Candidatus Termititenax persephonae]|uniref:Hemolysin n=1 Tax=Candidatus Termititenax persephonae TaxID=2218525 RepID=A0A388TG67_9BACT|nr:putative hemolysin [Candidatus Termititenax persephonae]
MLAETILVFVLLLVSAFFSCSETALTALSKHQLSLLKSRKVRGYKNILYLKQNPGIMLATILLGNNLVNIMLTTIGTLIVLKLLRAAGIDNEIWTTIITTCVVTFVVLVFGEVTPKTIGLSKARNFALFSGRLIVFFTHLFKPLVLLLNKFSNLVITLLGGQHLGKNILITEEELLSIIDAGQETGVIEKEEKNMLRDVIRFGDSFVGEVMTPLDNVLAVEASDTIEVLFKKIQGRLPSRVPVCRGGRRNIIGVLYLKDLLQKIHTTPSYAQKKIEEFQDLIRPPYIVYIDQKSAQVMRYMRFQHIHIAIVQNRDKKTVGILTFEDLLEEIIGEIQDEYEQS